MCRKGAGIRKKRSMRKLRITIKQDREDVVPVSAVPASVKEEAKAQQ